MSRLPKAPKLPLRQLAMHVDCVKCGVPIGVRCSNKKGEQRLSVHRERIQDARRFCEPFDNSYSVEPFYTSAQWFRVRYEALKKHGGSCQCCGKRWEPGSPLHVDHIKPRSRFPSLALSVDNLQVLCRACNVGKSNVDETDWRS